MGSASEIASRNFADETRYDLLRQMILNRGLTSAWEIISAEVIPNTVVEGGGALLGLAVFPPFHAALAPPTRRSGGGGRRVQEHARLNVLLNVLGTVEVERVEHGDPVQRQVVPAIPLHPLPQVRLRPCPLVQGEVGIAILGRGGGRRGRIAFGRPLAEQAQGEALLLAHRDAAEQAAIRQRMPVQSHCRFSVELV